MHDAHEIQHRHLRNTMTAIHNIIGEFAIYSTLSIYVAMTPGTVAGSGEGTCLLMPSLS